MFKKKKKTAGMFRTSNPVGEVTPKGTGITNKPVPAHYCPRTTLTSMNKVFIEKAEYIPVIIASRNNEQCRGMLIDISESGCQVAVPVIFQEGETLLVSLVINRHSITARATVRRITPQGGVNKVGMQFEGLAGKSKDFLRAISAVARLDDDEIEKMKNFLLAGRHN